jgi:tripartite motif-containing protein 71
MQRGIEAKARRLKYGAITAVVVAGAIMTLGGLSQAAEPEPKSPSAVAYSGQQLWVVDSQKQTVTLDGGGPTVGGKGTGPGQFTAIGGIATDANGDLYAADKQRVEEFSSKGTLLNTFGSGASGPGQLLEISGITVDPNGHVWVVNTRGSAPNDRIVEFSSSGGFITSFGSSGTAENQLGWVFGIAVDAGTVYVTETNVFIPEAGWMFEGSHNRGVQEFSETGGFIRRFDQGQISTWGIATDPATGDLYVMSRYQGTYSEYGRLSTFSSLGVLRGETGTGEGKEQLTTQRVGEFAGPEGIASDSIGEVAVADTGNHRVQKLVFVPTWEVGE